MLLFLLSPHSHTGTVMKKSFECLTGIKMRDIRKFRKWWNICSIFFPPIMPRKYFFMRITFLIKNIILSNSCKGVDHPSMLHFHSVFSILIMPKEYNTRVFDIVVVSGNTWTNTDKTNQRQVFYCVSPFLPPSVCANIMFCF